MSDIRTCNDIRSLMADWLDGELTPAQRSRVDEHIAVCDECRLRYSRMKAMDVDLALLGRAANRLADTAATDIRRARGWGRIWLRAAAVLVLLVGGYYFITSRANRDGRESFVERSLPKQKNDLQPPGGDDRVVVPPADCRAEGYTAVAIASSSPRVRIVWLFEDVARHVGSTNSSGGPSPRPQG